jgi:HD-like signal output (HDOD) protein/CheY-like chemotaxis protein
MKKRILFVDDEPLVLAGMQRMLRSLRQEWEMEFVESGARALARLAEASFDVVVTDMQMPGMNGAELLTEVMRLYPKTVRIVLSGHADKDLILKCVTSTHQYLSKPCESASLKATIQRACGLENNLENERLKQLVARMERFPSLPSLYVEMVEKLNDPNTTIEDIGLIVGKDMAMTAQILKLVNSAFFGLSRTVSSPFEAALYLGMDTIESLVLSIHAFSQFDDLKSCGFNLDALMLHSLNTAARAKQIAQLEEASAKVCEECFVAGMLHDTGKLVLAANYPKDYERASQLVRAGGLSTWAAEKEIFGADHASVGGYLLGLWGLPVPVVEAIALHHSPQQCTSPDFSALTAVHVANVLEHERTAADNAVAVNELDSKYLAALGLTHRADAWRQSSLIHEPQETHA